MEQVNITGIKKAYDWKDGKYGREKGIVCNTDNGEIYVKVKNEDQEKCIMVGGLYSLDVYRGTGNDGKPYAIYSFPRQSGGAKQGGGRSGWQPKPTYSPAVWAAFAADMWRVANALSKDDAANLFGFLLGSGAQNVDLSQYAKPTDGKPSDKVQF